MPGVLVVAAHAVNVLLRLLCQVDLMQAGLHCHHLAA